MSIQLTKTAETGTTVTLTWTPPAGVGSYTFYANGEVVSVASKNLKDGSPRTSVKFHKTNPGSPYHILAVCRSSAGTYTLEAGAWADTLPPSTSVKWGIKIENWYTANLGVPHYAPEAARRLGAKIGRVEYGPGQNLDTKIPLLIQYEVKAQPLFNTHGRVPTSAEVQTLAAIAAKWGPNGTFWQGRSDRDRFAVTHIEFLNETSGEWYFGTNDYFSATYRARAREYARKAKEAAQILAPHGVGLLIQADEVAPNGVWVDEMFAAVPDLADHAAGWTVHPYGGNSAWYGVPRVTRTRDRLAARGETSKPFYFTEWGIATANGVPMEDNYGLSKGMTYQQCAEQLARDEAAWKQALGPRLAQVLVYTQFDGSSNTSRESNFGLYEYNTWQEKGVWTAAIKQRFAA